MNLIKLFGVSALVLGLAACGEADKAASTEDTGHATEAAVAEAVTDVEETVKVSADKVKSKFDTEKFEGGASGDVSTAPAPAFKISDNLEPGQYVNSNGEIVTNKDVSKVKENPTLREIPEGMEPGSIEHTMWVLEQE